MAEPIHATLFIVPPLFGTLIAFLLGLKGRNQARYEFQNDLEIENKIQRTKGKFFTMLHMPITTIFFGFSILRIGYFSSSEIPDEVMIAVGINIGMAGFFTAVGTGLIIQIGVKDIVLHEKKFGKYLVMCTIPETTVIFAFAISFLTIGFDAGVAGELVKANYIMGTASIGGLVSGIIIRVMGPVSDDELNFGRLITFGTFGTIITIMGFAYAFLILGAA